jgi:mevalonate kinase
MKQQQKIRISAPGKIILLGEHAVVYGKPAIIAAVNKRCFVELTARSDKEIIISVKNSKQEVITNVKQLENKFNKAQEDWDIVNRNNDTKLLKLITKDLLDYPQIIIGEFLNYFKAFNEIISGFELSIELEIPIGSGMGSSASLAVSIIGALLCLKNQKFDKKIINEIAFLAEQKKHGFPSGGDNTACCYGGLILFHKDAPDENIFSQIPVTISPNIPGNFITIFTGIPEESTGELVSKVRNLYQRNQESVDQVFNSQEELTNELLIALKNGEEEKIIAIIKNGEKNLEHLGVVSSSVKSLIREIEKTGGAAKICGAGGIAKGSGMLLAYHQDIEILKGLLGEYEYAFSRVVLGAEGVRIEAP